MFTTLYSSVFPLVQERYSSKVQFIFRQQIQPWHPASTLVHEAAAAVLRVSPGKFYDYSAALFERQEENFDVNVVIETRNETYERLARLAVEMGVEEYKIMDLLRISDKPGKDGSLNAGNGVTDDVKLMVKVGMQSLTVGLCVLTWQKANRLTGVHVTPTVLFNVSSYLICALVNANP